MQYAIAVIIINNDDLDKQTFRISTLLFGIRSSPEEFVAGKNLKFSRADVPQATIYIKNPDRNGGTP